MQATINPLTRIIQRRYDRIAGVFDLIEGMMEWRFKTWRQRLWQALPHGGSVLEAGIGTGKNLPYHPSHASLVGIDFSAGMLTQAQRRKRQLPGNNASLSQMDVQNLAFPDQGFDAIVATFLFCSVPDPVAGLRELGRVLKPGGRIYLLEHVRSEHPVLGWLMDCLNPLVVRLVGANINRRTVGNIRAAGLLIEKEENLTAGNLVKYLILRRADGS